MSPIGSASSAHFSSCRQATSGFSRSSHSTSRGIRARIPLMLNDAIFIPAPYPLAPSVVERRLGGISLTSAFDHPDTGRRLFRQHEFRTEEKKDASRQPVHNLNHPRAPEQLGHRHGR